MQAAQQRGTVRRREGQHRTQYLLSETPPLVQLARNQRGQRA